MPFNSDFGNLFRRSKLPVKMEKIINCHYCPEKHCVPTELNNRCITIYRPIYNPKGIALIEGYNIDNNKRTFPT